MDLAEHNRRMLEAAHRAFNERSPPIDYEDPYAMNVNQLIRSRYINREECASPITTYIRGVSWDQPRPNEQPIAVLLFTTLAKPMKLNNSILNYLKVAIGEETDHWTGKKCQVYFDPSITFGNNRVGGIRIRIAPSHMLPGAAAQLAALTAPAQTAGFAQPQLAAPTMSTPPPATFHHPAPQAAPVAATAAIAPNPNPSHRIGPNAAVDASTGEIAGDPDFPFNDEIPF